MMMGASCDTPMVCCAAVRYGSGADLPQGNAAHTAHQFSVPLRTYPYLSVPTAPPAAAQQTAAAMQNLIAKNYRRVMPLADLPQGNAAHTQRLVCESDVSVQAFFHLKKSGELEKFVG